jgi:hypothetical protein
MNVLYPDPAPSWPVMPPAPLPQASGRRFRVRTVLIPLLFLGLHWLAVNLVAMVYLIAYVMLSGSILDPLAVLQDEAFLNQLLIEQYPIISAIYATALIPLYYLFLYVQRRRDARALWLDRPQFRQILPALAVMIGVMGLTNIWFNLLDSLRHTLPPIGEMLDDYVAKAGAFGPTVGYFWLILGISILTPIAEELLFRGIIQGELRRAMPEWAAVLIQGIIFALFHMQPIQISYVILPGILLGLAYAWTRSLWVPILMHIGFNFLGSVLPALIGDDEMLQQILGWSELAFILIGALCLAYLFINRRTAAQIASRPA